MNLIEREDANYCSWYTKLLITRLKDNRVLFAIGKLILPPMRVQVTYYWNNFNIPKKNPFFLGVTSASWLLTDISTPVSSIGLPCKMQFDCVDRCTCPGFTMIRDLGSAFKNYGLPEHQTPNTSGAWKIK